MNDPKVDCGQTWVEKRIRELARELGRPVDCLEWPRPADPTIAGSFAANAIPLRIWRGGEFQIVEFLETELHDVEATPEIHARLERRIRQGLK